MGSKAAVSFNQHSTVEPSLKKQIRSINSIFKSTQESSLEPSLKGLRVLSDNELTIVDKVKFEALPVGFKYIGVFVSSVFAFVFLCPFLATMAFAGYFLVRYLLYAFPVFILLPNMFPV